MIQVREWHESLFPAHRRSGPTDRPMRRALQQPEFSPERRSYPASVAALFSQP
jgi:hypothetical protein